MPPLKKCRSVCAARAQGNYFYYSRSDNPNYLLLERELTRLHHGRQSPRLFILFNVVILILYYFALFFP